MSQMDYTMFPVKWIHRDPRWRNLSKDHKSQLVYRTLWGCPHTTYSGLFHCPYPYICYDLDLPEHDIEQSYSRLAEVGLIEFNELTGFVRLVSWYEWRYCPRSYCNLKGRTADYLSGGYPTDLLTSKSIAEMVVQSFKLARGFSRERQSSIKHAVDYCAELESLVRKATERFSGFESALMSEFAAKGRELCEEVEFLVAGVPGLSLESAHASGLDVISPPLETPSKRSLGGLETSTRQEERKKKIEKETSITASYNEQNSRPLLETTRSPLAVAARETSNGR